VTEVNREQQGSPAGENTSEVGSRETSELGSVGETNQVERNPTEMATLESFQQPSASKSSDLTQMLAGIMAATQQTNENVRADINSIRAELAANNEGIKAMLAATKESVRAELVANNEILKESVRSEQATSHENFKTEVSKIRK
jgi:hypothetical protein